jgi:transcriptional regulator with XRE-family HTH domain
MPHTTRLEQERRAAGLSQADLAFTARIAQATVSKIEHLKLRSPSHNLLERLARALRHHGREVTAADLDPGTPVMVRARPRAPRPKAKPKSLAQAAQSIPEPILA